MFRDGALAIEPLRFGHQLRACAFVHTLPRSSTTARCVIGRIICGFCSTIIALMPSSRTKRAIERSGSSTPIGEAFERLVKRAQLRVKHDAEVGAVCPYRPYGSVRRFPGNRHPCRDRQQSWQQCEPETLPTGATSLSNS